ncbi:MAG: hypothetical protein IPJ40_10635 [Saprospirales bacterium]|nr:hypothetical protein [Saprospirales bacterium]
MTGEAEPVRKQVGEKLYAGGRQVGERIEVTLTKSVAKLPDPVVERRGVPERRRFRHQRLADKVGRYFTFMILLISFATLAHWLPAT